MVWFRTDASFQIGTGHVMRCLTLANALRERGCECHFVCRAHAGNLIDRISEHGHIVHPLPTSEEPDHVATFKADDPAHQQWLGTDWQTDATQTLAAIGDAPVDWLIVDHYALEACWEQRLRTHCKQIMVIDDLADRPHDCDLLLDQNLIADWQLRYQEKVPTNCALMLGPSYALLQPPYGQLHTRVPPREGPVRRVLIYFGGADHDNLTGMAMSALASMQAANLSIDVVVNPQSAHVETLRHQIMGHPSATLYTHLNSLAPLMVKADLAIGASGTTSWERCCLGLPSLVVTLADNQIPIAAELDRLGMIRWLGHKDRIQVAHLVDALTSLVEGGLPSSWSQRCQQAVDGRGVHRVCSALMLTPSSVLRARPAKVSDESFITQWISPKESPEAIVQFRNGLRDLDNSRMFIAETNDEFAVGTVRFYRIDDAWHIQSFLAPPARKPGVDRALLQTAIGAIRQDWADALRLNSVSQVDHSRHAHETLRKHQATTSAALSIGVCSDPHSWINDSIPELVLQWLTAGHRVSWAHNAAHLPGGDVCFYLSYGRIVDTQTRSRYRNNLVVHASDLPKGRGWSPASWLILEGKSRIPVTLLEAVDPVDAGPIYLQEWIDLDGTELIDDWRKALAHQTIHLASTFVERYPAILNSARAQVGQPSNYPRRRAQDSELDPHQTLASQINQLRIADNDSYPAFFHHQGKTFVLKISKR
ncbi:MAG TPA: UDP-2,4-diacetamido-2,4,6-trideoxy-beta-L-altropyranose hydrolase [Burkholderiaceae bacterium]|nr:UDP-2,4-diacetamido-2,4,6-trideoxy-beta-L-altropyranose hydrolase [Burkholderiaceae bacterium]